MTHQSDLPDKSPLRILVIECDRRLLRSIQTHLQNAGYVVETATDGLAGFEALKRNPPDALVCWVMMPSRDGFEILALQRADPRLRDIPVILLTVMDNNGQLIEPYPDGILRKEVSLKKPFEMSALLEAVKQFIG